MKLRRNIRLSIMLSLAVLSFLAALVLTLNAQEPAANPAGTWQVVYIHDGKPLTYQPTLILTRAGKKLTGMITRNTGSKIESLPVENGNLQTGKISFNTSFFSQVFQAGVLQPPDTNYMSHWKFEGTLSGDTIKGTIEKESPAGHSTLDWEANRITK
jgi:hypothetical protein